jgi:hypothetical protein
MRIKLAFALLSLVLCAPAQAQEATAISQSVEIVTGPVCDTQEEVQRYIALYDGDAEATVTALNAEAHDPHACGMATVAYLRGPQTGAGWKHDTGFEIVRILVVGVDTKGGIRAVSPAAYFTVFSVREPAV